MWAKSGRINETLLDREEVTHMVYLVIFPPVSSYLALFPHFPPPTPPIHTPPFPLPLFLLPPDSRCTSRSGAAVTADRCSTPLSRAESARVLRGRAGAPERSEGANFSVVGGGELGESADADVDGIALAADEQTDVIRSPETHPAAATAITAGLIHTSNHQEGLVGHYVPIHTHLTRLCVTHAQIWTHMAAPLSGLTVTARRCVSDYKN